MPDATAIYRARSGFSSSTAAAVARWPRLRHWPDRLRPRACPHLLARACATVEARVCRNRRARNGHGRQSEPLPQGEKTHRERTPRRGKPGGVRTRQIRAATLGEREGPAPPRTRGQAARLSLRSALRRAERQSISLDRRLVKTDEENPLRHVVFGEMRAHRIDRDARRRLFREAVHAGRDGGKRYLAKPPLDGDHEARAIAVRQNFMLARIAATPDRTDRMDHVSGGEAVSGS